MKRNTKAESRMNCGDVDSCGGSTKAARAVWDSRAAGTERAATRDVGGVALQHGRGQRESPRMSCPEGEECAISSKAAQKFWAEQAIKAGTKSPSQIASERAAQDRAVAERIERQAAERKAHRAQSH